MDTEKLRRDLADMRAIAHAEKDFTKRTFGRFT
jgi:hypothetical protein